MAFVAQCPVARSSANRYATHVKSCTDCVCLAFVVSHLIIYSGTGACFAGALRNLSPKLQTLQGLDLV